jgi:hypothetical protein
MEDVRLDERDVQVEASSLLGIGRRRHGVIFVWEVRILHITPINLPILIASNNIGSGGATCKSVEGVGANDTIEFYKFIL